MGTTKIRVGQLGIDYIVDGSNSASIGLFELTVPPGSNVPPPHSHSNNEECVYVLAGTLRYTVGAETRDLTPGQSMSTPKGVVHAFSNPFTETSRALIVQSPDIGAQYFKDVAVVVNAGGPPDKAALLSVMSVRTCPGRAEVTPHLSLNADVPHAGLRPGSGPPVS